MTSRKLYDFIMRLFMFLSVALTCGLVLFLIGYVPVSYTHLTLPTTKVV